MIKQFLFSNIVFPLVELCSSTNFWSLYKEMLRFQNSDDRQRSKFQHKKLATLIKTAGKDVEYWQEVFVEAGIDVNSIVPENAVQTLKKIPVTNKLVYCSGFPDKITVKGTQDNWQYLSSAGTTDRMTVVTDFNKRDHLRAAEHLNLNIAIGQPLGKPGIDVPPHACNIICGLADEGPEPLFQYIIWSINNKSIFSQTSISDLRGRIERQILLNRKTLLPVKAASWDEMKEQLDNYLDMILDENIEVLRGLPHFLFWLAKRAKERNLKFSKIKAVLPYGGLASEIMIKQISNAFFAPFINVYGTGEVGAIGCSEKNDDAIMVYQNLVYLEILDDDNEPVEKGKPGKIVVTDLTNFAMPIIRYEIGDIGVAIQSQEEDNLPRVIQILGRQQESIITSKGKLVTARDLQNLFFGYENILNFKLVQISNDLFKAVIVCNNEVDKKSLAKDLAELLGTSLKPSIKESAFITPEASGKYVAFKVNRLMTHV